MQFRMPSRPLASGLRLLYEMSVKDMIKVVKQHNSVEIYTEHKIMKDYIGISSDNVGICDLTCEKDVVKEITKAYVSNATCRHPISG